MSNMSYCRFENTYRALLDCSSNLDDSLSASETRYRKQLVELCSRIIDQYDPEIDEDDYQDYRSH